MWPADWTWPWEKQEQREEHREGELGRTERKEADSETDRCSVHSQTSKAVRRTEQLGKGKPVS